MVMDDIIKGTKTKSKPVYTGKLWSDTIMTSRLLASVIGNEPAALTTVQKFIASSK